MQQRQRKNVEFLLNESKHQDMTIQLFRKEKCRKINFQLPLAHTQF